MEWLGLEIEDGQACEILALPPPFSLSSSLLPWPGSDRSQSRLAQSPDRIAICTDAQWPGIKKMGGGGGKRLYGMTSLRAATHQHHVTFTLAAGCDLTFRTHPREQ